MYNRYKGNTGFFETVPDQPPLTQDQPSHTYDENPIQPQVSTDDLHEPENLQDTYADDNIQNQQTQTQEHRSQASQPHQGQGHSHNRNQHNSGRHTPGGNTNQSRSNPRHNHNPEPTPPSDSSQDNNPAGIQSLLKGGLSGLIDKLNLKNLETEDYIVMLILFLLYKDSKDEEYLIMLAAMLFL